MWNTLLRGSTKLLSMAAGEDIEEMVSKLIGILKSAIICSIKVRLSEIITEAVPFMEVTELYST